MWQGKSVSRRSKLWIAGVCGLVAVQVCASLLLPPSYQLSVVSDLNQCALLLLATFAIIPNVSPSRSRTTRTRLFWFLMLAGVLFWLSYQLLWTYFEVILKKEVPNMFVGDVVLFLHLVPMMAALALEPETQQDERTSRVGTLDFALLLMWWVFLYCYSVLPWQYAYPDELNYSHNFNALYLTEKVALLTGLATLAILSKGPWRKVYGLWFGASAMYATSSYVANWGIATHDYYTGSFYDIPLTISMMSISIVGVVSTRLQLHEERVATRTSHGVWGARWGMVAIFSLPLFAAWSIAETSTPVAVRSFRLVLTLGAIMAMGAMVFLRQHLLDRELIRLLRSSEESFEGLKRLQAQLVQSEKLASLGQLVGGAAHELNNPLTAMLGYADLLSATPLNEEQRAIADKIGIQVRRTKSLVASLLSFAKQAPSEKSRIDINALCQTALNLLQPQLRTHHVKVEMEMGSSLPPVLGDSSQLLQVCLHIATNAFQSLEEVGGGTIRVRTGREGSNLILEIADNGPGVKEPDKVFDPFYTTKALGKGVGLGLSACYGIIHEHGGRIVCRNGDDRGAHFRIELPVAGRGSEKALAMAAVSSAVTGD